MIRNIKQLFSTIKFPYKLTGVKSQHNNMCNQLAIELFGNSLPLGFQYAFKALLEILPTEDASSFLQENCDPQLRKAFLIGLTDIAKNNRTLQVIYSQVEPSTLIADVALNLYYDYNLSYGEQAPKMSHLLSEGTKLHFYQTPMSGGMGNKTPSPSVCIGAYIKSDCYLSISDSTTLVDGYHHVLFQTVPQDKPLQVQNMSLSELMRLALDRSQHLEFLKKMIASDVSWKIVNIDHFLAKPKGVIAHYFSSHYFPYNPKGYKQPYRSDIGEFLIKDTLQIDPAGFIYAFNNLIASINHSDFLEFARQVCGSHLALAFEDGLNRGKIPKAPIEVIYDREIEEDCVIGKCTDHIWMDQSEEFYDQKPSFVWRTKFQNIGIHWNNITQTPRINLEVDAFIKCKTSLRLPLVEHSPLSYHKVKFICIRESPDVTLGEMLQKGIKNVSPKQMYLGESHHWKIVNIDRFLRYR